MDNQNSTVATHVRQRPRCDTGPSTDLSPENRRGFLISNLAFFLRQVRHGRELRSDELASLLPYCADSKGSGVAA